MAKRISYTIPRKHPEKKQTVRAILKYKKLIDKVIQIVASEDTIRDDGYPKSQIAINWGQSGAPEWFCKPSNRKRVRLSNQKLESDTEGVDKNGNLLYNACRVLICLYENGYTEYTPSKIFRARQGLLGQTTALETEIDKLLDIEEFDE